jgi:hypothetical protein
MESLIIPVKYSEACCGAEKSQRTAIKELIYILSDF